MPGGNFKKKINRAGTIIKQYRVNISHKWLMIQGPRCGPCFCWWHQISFLLCCVAPRKIWFESINTNTKQGYFVGVGVRGGQMVWHSPYHKYLWYGNSRFRYKKRDNQKHFGSMSRDLIDRPKFSLNIKKKWIHTWLMQFSWKSRHTIDFHDIRPWL